MEEEGYNVCNENIGPLIRYELLLWLQDAAIICGGEVTSQGMYKATGTRECRLLCTCFEDKALTVVRSVRLQQSSASSHLIQKNE